MNNIIKKYKKGDVMIAKKIWKDKNYVDVYNRNFILSSCEKDYFVEMLELNEDDSLIDFGCGNGDFLIEVCNRVKYGWGFDISEYQLNEVDKKIVDKKIKNIKLIRSAFQDIYLGRMQFDKGFSRGALHHITDKEKYFFFNKISKSFRKGSRFLIYDIIYTFCKKDVIGNLPIMLKDAELYYGDQWEMKKHEVIRGWLNEHGTDYKTWKNILLEAGFKTLYVESETSFIHLILAEKI
jgi:cyclopropane fatty-acyl-phospholipid synthase-like methyltransferase